MPRSSGGWRCIVKYREGTREEHRLNRERNREYLNKVKLESGCSECGYNAHPAALSFHHIDPTTKSFTIGDSSGRSLKRLIVEIAKCIILCENCHRTLAHEGALT